RDGDNVARAAAFFAGEYRPRSPHERGMLLSAARAYLFNEVLAQRVRDGSWNHIHTGDVMMLAGSHSVFPVAEVDANLRVRVAAHDIHPTGPMWGKGPLMSGGAIARLETDVVGRYPALCAGLEHWDLRQERRNLVLRIGSMEIGAQNEGVRLCFELEAGAYATTVVREISRRHLSTYSTNIDVPG
ncbi:MAG: tRNA pseudouridine(13) synthase TruD, partial [Pseudomonadota bacterium]